MTEHIVTVLIQNPDHLKVFANSSHADSIMRFLKIEGVELSAKADDPVVMATLQQGSNGAASHYVLTYEFTVSSTIEEFSALIDRWTLTMTGSESSDT